MVRIAINGFGRIGRNFLRTILQNPLARKKLEVVAINLGPAKKEFVAHMFMYDTLMGTYQGSVTLEDNVLVIDGVRIQLLTELDPVKLPWKSLNIDWVVECTGHFTKREGASKHLQAGAQYVLISAPAHDEDVTIIPGVNDAMFNPQQHKIVSMGSCTTNAVLTMLKVLHDTFTIQRSFMTTVHAYTNSQVLLDVEAKDLRRSRAAALNIIPTTTGAMNVMGKVIPDLAGCVQAIAIRVPVAKVSLIDLTVITKESLTVDAINAAFLSAAQGPMRGILAITTEPLVSSDFNGNSHSSIIDGLLTTTCGQHSGKAFGWYDNEWGYSCRLRDFLVSVGK
jgi:glyceraldehyde 3-phosphate dehydrogenase